MGIDDKKMELLKKLYALAERGDRGERAAARHQLEKLLKKYNINEADLSDEVLEIHWFTYKTPEEKKLFDQVCYKIAKDRATYKKNFGTGQRTHRGIKCTKAEALQIGIEFEFYKNLWHEELDFFLSAFIQKHEIFDTTPGHKVSDPPSKEEMLRMAQLMAGMQDRTMHKMIDA